MWDSIRIESGTRKRKFASFLIRFLVPHSRYLHSINSVELHESERRKLIPHCYEWRVREWIGREEVPEWCIRLYYVASEPLGST